MHSRMYMRVYVFPKQTLLKDICVLREEKDNRFILYIENRKKDIVHYLLFFIHFIIHIFVTYNNDVICI